MTGFAIAVQQQQYKTYILTDHDAQSRIEVVPERGGIITRWQLQDEEILYLDAERFANPDLTVRGGIPILFPICGNLPNNTYTIHDKQYHLKQHGFARDLPWQVIDQQTQECASITLLLESNDQTKQLYPFDFQVIFTYQLKGHTLEIRQTYTNNSTESMPFSTGLHPYFVTLNKTALQFQIPSNEYRDQRNNTIHPYTGSFDYQSDEIDVEFRHLNDCSASVTDRSRNLHLHLSYDETYSRVVFWTVKGKDFYCLEPWTAPRNAINTGEQLIILEPEASLETVVALSVTLS